MGKIRTRRLVDALSHMESAEHSRHFLIEFEVGTETEAYRMFTIFPTNSNESNARQEAIETLLSIPGKVKSAGLISIQSLS